MRYQSNPVIVEAFQYDGDLMGSDGKYYVPDWAVEAYEKRVMYYKVMRIGEPPCELFVDTPAGTLHVSVGDYVIKGTKGELYPCKPDIFQEIYSRYVPLSPLLEEPVTLGGKNEERAKM